MVRRLLALGAMYWHPARTVLLAAAAAVALPPASAEADPRTLKSNVVIVKPQYHQNTRKAFTLWSQTLVRLAEMVEREKPNSATYANALRALAREYQAQSEAPGHGSGWLWIPKDSEVAYVITNRHVAGQAESVTIEFDKGRQPAIFGNKVIYVDPSYDMAVIEVPRGELPREAIGFELIDTLLTEGSPVWAAGFPGTDTERGFIAAYSLTNGIVSNAEYPGPQGPAIAHTATIDPGNSGGPLLVEVPTAPLGYRVAGMNTWKSTTRTNVNIGLPVPVIRSVLRAAMDARATAGDRNRLRAELRRTAERLADELGSSRPDKDLLEWLISYSFVAERPGVIGDLIKEMITGQMDAKQFEQFLAAPVEHARRRLWEKFFETFSTGRSNVGEVRLQSITDQDRIAAGVHVRTIYQVAGKKQEIVWIWEHGAWRIADATFEQAWGIKPATQQAMAGTNQPGTALQGGANAVQPAAGASASASVATMATRAPGVSVAVKIGTGSSGASSDNFGSELDTIGATAFGLEIAVPLSRHVWFASGANYAPFGTEYLVSAGEQTAAIHEEVTYLQVPALLRFEAPIARPTATVRLSGRAGLSLDIAAREGGSFTLSGGGMGSLAEPELDWFGEHTGMNVGAVVGAGAEVGFGANPSFYVGLEVTHERHLLDEWSDAFFTGAANYRYNATRFGLTLKYQSLKD